MILVVLWTSLGGNALTPPWDDLLPYWLDGVLAIWAGLSLWRAEQRHPMLGLHLLGALLILHGLHLLDYPWMQEVAWFRPLGFLIAAGLILAVGMTFLLIAANWQRQQAEHLAERLREQVRQHDQVARELQRTDSLFQTLYHRTPVMMHVQDSNGRIEAVSDFWLEYLGFQRGEVLGRPFNDFLADSGRAYMADQGWQRLSERGDLLNVEMGWCRHDGTTLDVLMSAAVDRGDHAGDRVLVVAVDISERKAIQSALVASERRFRRIFDSATNIAVQGYAADGTVIYWNAASERFFGYTAAEALGRSLGDLLLGPAEMTEFLKKANASLESHIPPEPAEMTVRCADGALLAVYSSQVVIQNRRGEAEIYCIDLDLSEIKALRRELAVADQRFIRFAESSTLGAFSFDAQGRFEFANARYGELVGMRPVDLVGQSWHAVLPRLHPDDVSTFLEDWDSLMHGGHEAVSERRFIHGESRVTWVRVRVVPMMEGGALVGAVGTMEDVTERKHMEQALRDSEERFSRVFQLLPDAVILTDPGNGRFIDVNHAWQALSGFSRDDTIGCTALELGFWIDSGQRALFLQRLEQEGEVRGSESDARRKDGRRILCMVSARYVEVGGRRLMMTILRDVTDERANERAVLELNQRLEEKVSERTAELEAANAELAGALETLQRAQDELVRAEKLASLGELVAGIAHELNTPVGNGVTVTSTLVEKTAEFAEQLERGNLKRSVLSAYLDNVRMAGDLLTRNLEQADELIAGFKQVAVDQTSAKRRRFDLRHTLEEVMATLAPTFKKSPLRLHLDVRVDTEMDSFPGPLGQVITNLVQNAQMHGLEGRAHGEVSVVVYDSGEGRIRLEVRDDGVGIATEQQKRIFDPFYTTKLGQGGSGLGLHIVYSLVTRVLGGRVWVESEPGKGATFIVDMPVNAPESTA